MPRKGAQLSILKAFFKGAIVSESLAAHSGPQGTFAYDTIADHGPSSSEFARDPYLGIFEGL